MIAGETRVSSGYNLEAINPPLSKEWHPDKNGQLRPHDVTPGSGQLVWWRCIRGHEWTAAVFSRNSGVGCPYCGGHRATSETCLQAVNKRLAREWHPSKNGSLTPKAVLPNSGQKVWWKCSNGHEWQAQIQSRNKGCGCACCSERWPRKFGQSDK